MGRADCKGLDLAELIQPRSFRGLMIEEVTQVRGLPPAAKRHLTDARAWLFERLDIPSPKRVVHCIQASLP